MVTINVLNVELVDGSTLKYVKLSTANTFDSIR